MFFWNVSLTRLQGMTSPVNMCCDSLSLCLPLTNSMKLGLHCGPYPNPDESSQSCGLFHSSFPQELCMQLCYIPHPLCLPQSWHLFSCSYSASVTYYFSTLQFPHSSGFFLVRGTLDLSLFSLTLLFWLHWVYRLCCYALFAATF
jgi:hypothetical protein